jgi:predicted dehydrogenase
MIGVGVIGYGYWGPNLVRNFAEVPGSRMVSVCDFNPSRLTAAQARYPGIKTTTSVPELINDPAVDAVVIATPVSSHFELAFAALEAGKHVLVEKPLTATSEQGRRLIEEADRRGLTLMVDHTFVYNGAVRKVRGLVASGELGKIYYYDSTRINLGLFQHDVNVLWDLAVHDLSIMDFLLSERPRAVSATGLSHLPNQPENIAYLTMFFDNRLIAHIHVNWLSPVKVRRTLIGGSSKMVVYDDLEPSEKIKVYDRGITLKDRDEGLRQMLIGYRTGDMYAPQFEMAEALRTEAIHFLNCIDSGERPVSDAESGLRVVRILEAACRSMADRGSLIEL